jgi:DNA-directed RNA polymerase specialized sigma24 family protein
VPKLSCQSKENIENTAEALCEQYLPKILQYLNYWVNDQEIAERMTLKAIKEALIKYGDCYKDERKLSTGIFKCARKEILDYLKANTVKPVLPGLSVQEQEVISLRLAAVMNDRMISKLLELSESKVGTVVSQSLCKLKDRMDMPAGS